LTSLINFAAINENFPVAGQDNDTQVFRDNFDTIKTNFSAAKTEIEDLQDNAARTDTTSDFSYNVVTTVTLQDAVLRKRDYGAAILAATQEVSFKQALYHIIRFGEPPVGASSCAIQLIDFPLAEVDILGFGACGKITLELYGDGAAAISAGSFVPGTSYQIVTLGTTTNTQWNTIAGTSSVTYTVGSLFTTANAGTGLGNGTARIARTISFTPTGSQSWRKNASASWVGTTSNPAIRVASATDPVILEVWQHSADQIFLNYLGQFSS
jgi:hypothetical protein